MDLRRSRYLAALCLLAVLVVAAAVLLVDAPGRATGVTVERDSPDVAEREPAALQHGDVERPIERPIELAGDEESSQGRSAAQAQAQTQTETTDQKATSSQLTIEVTPSPWLQKAGASVRFHWTAPGEEATSHSVRLREGRFGPVELEGDPRSIDEFTDVRVSGLQAKALALREEALHGPRSERPRFTLDVELETGATVVWDDSVAAPDRVPVSLSLGGAVSPPSREVWSFGVRSGLTPYLEEVELPIELPRLVEAESLWVGGPGQAWTAFPVEPESERVAIWQTKGVMIRVTHDRDPAQGDEFAWAMSFPSGDAERSRIVRDGTLLLGPRPSGTLEVWISNGEDTDSPRMTRTARFEASAGETVDVDLTDAYADEHLGRAFVEIAPTDDTLGVARSDVRLDLRRRTEHDPRYAWLRAGEFEEAAPTVDGGWAYSAKGLEPGDYRVLVQPPAHRIDFRVEPGACARFSVAFDDVGWIEADSPGGSTGSVQHLSLATVESNPRERSYFSLGQGVRTDGRRRWPVTPGRYAVRNTSFGGKNGWSSHPFDVDAGQVVRVALFEREDWDVHVRAKDAETGEPITLDLAFWIRVLAVDTSTGHHCVGSTGFHGTDAAYDGVDWHLERIDRPVEVEIPEHRDWTFEEVEPLFLEDGMTIEIVARRR
ncbi:MAG: hypothetical protein AAF726_09115 [Planctomycetota bacterium]